MAIISFDIAVTDLDAVLALYDRIQVWRAATSDGTYAEITADADEPAAVDGSQEGPWELDGLILTIQQGGGTVVSVAFDGTDPLNLVQVLEQINAAVPAIASELEDTGRVRIETAQTGTSASLVLGGAAAIVLGLSTVKASGKSHRLYLTDPTTVYRFRDFGGLVTDYYKTRFYSSITGAVSEFSASRQGVGQFILPESTTSIAKIDLADGSGRPVVGRRVIFVPVSVQAVDSSGTTYGVLPGVDRIVAMTNDRGHAEIALVRGARFRVFVEGVQFQREITIPDTNEFDLLAALTAAPDPFNITQTPPMPIRNS